MQIYVILFIFYISFDAKPLGQGSVANKGRVDLLKILWKPAINTKEIFERMLKGEILFFQFFR